MALIQWDDTLSININEIDQEHKHLIGLLNKLSDEMRAGKAKEALGRALNDLTSYAATHFGHEEKYMQMYKYPAYQAHKNEHDAFVKKVLDFKKGFEEGKLTISLDVLKFVKDWVATHIQRTDRQYVDTFKAHGMK